MASVIKRGTGGRALALGRSDIAGKTGTTNEAKDTWRSLGEAEEGARTGLPIWIQFMREALQGVPEQRRSRTAAALEQTRD